MQPRLLCALALAALLPLARAQSCPDDPDHVLASYGLNCDVLQNAYACDVDLKRLGWAVDEGTTVADECPSKCGGCTDTNEGADDLQDNLPAEQRYLNIAYQKPVVTDSNTGHASRLTDGFAGPNNEWVSTPKRAPHWAVIDLQESLQPTPWIESIYLFAGEQRGDVAGDQGVCAWQLFVWQGEDQQMDLETVAHAEQGWVVATHSHPNDPLYDEHTAHMNFPPVQTRFVKLLIDQSGCGPDLPHEQLGMAASATVAEIQIIHCVICTSPPLEDPDRTGMEVQTYGHTLVGYWALDDHSLRDYAGGDHDGEIVGNVIVMHDPARGSVLEFFGTPNSYVQVPRAMDFDLNSYSVMFWMQAYDIGRKQAIFAHGESFETDFDDSVDDKTHDDNTDKSQYIVFLKEGGHIQHWSESAGRDETSRNAHVSTETDFYSSSDFQLRERVWVHVCVTRGEDNAVQFYINGELDSHHEPESGFNDPHFLHIITLGARTQGRGTYQDWFTGALDDIRLFSAEVSAATVGEIYQESSRIMCDSSALSELMNAVNHQCCDDPDVEVDCSIGVPTACSVDCASAFLPLWQNCQDELDSSGAGSTFHDFAAMCGEAAAAGALSTCGYTELLPIIMACTDGTENFCTSSCYSRLRSYIHACYGVMPREASTFIASMEAQMDQCNGMPGTSDRDLGASCDVYSIVNKCNAFGYEAIAGALRAEQETTDACDEKTACLGTDGDGDPFESTDPTDHDTCLSMPDTCFWDDNPAPGPFGVIQNCQPLPFINDECGDGESPQLEILCESECAQEILGSYSICSIEPAVQAVFGMQCSEVIDHDMDGDVDMDDQECTNRGDVIVNNTEVCSIQNHGLCPGTCTGEHAPHFCDNNAVDGDPNDAINGGDGDGDDGLCQNEGICIDWTHNTMFLPRCGEDNPECFITDPGPAPQWLIEMFPDADPEHLVGYDNVLLPQDEMMCGCKPKSGFIGRFCSCTSVEQLITKCQVTQAGEQCQNAFEIMDNELSALCHITELSDFASADVVCSMACANLFSPFYSVCGEQMWPTKDPAGNPLPTSGPVYEALLAKGIDVVFNNHVDEFNQQCAVAGGREDGQTDYCVAKPCDQCRNEDGCGWCMGRNVCSNECVTVDGECAATEHDASGAGVVDPCATKTDCASCNMKSICGWCVDGARNVCSSTCAPESTVDDCTSWNDHIHDGHGNGGHGDGPGGGH